MKLTLVRFRFCDTSISKGERLPCSVLPAPAQGADATVVPGLNTPEKLVTSSANKALLPAPQAAVIGAVVEGTVIVLSTSDGFNAVPPVGVVYHLMDVPGGSVTVYVELTGPEQPSTVYGFG